MAPGEGAAMPRCSAAAGPRTMQKNRGRGGLAHGGSPPPLVIDQTNRPRSMPLNHIEWSFDLRLIFAAGIDLMRPAHYYYEKSPALFLRY